MIHYSKFIVALAQDRMHARCVRVWHLTHYLKWPDVNVLSNADPTFTRYSELLMTNVLCPVIGGEKFMRHWSFEKDSQNVDFSGRK